jgi:ABC-type Na+ transport system ATPase subunit NatA
MARYWMDSVSLDGFRNVRNLHLEGLGGLNVLVGENNSGKTSVLEALSILANFDEPTEWLKMVGRRDFGRLDETRVQSIRWCFDRTRLARPADGPFVAHCRLSCAGKLGEGFLDVSCEDITGEPAYSSLSDPDEPPVDEVDVPEVRRGVLLTYKIGFPDRGVLFHDLLPAPLQLPVWEDHEPALVPHRLRRERRVDTETLNPYSYQINRLQVRRLSGGRLAHSVGPLLDLIRQFDSQIEDIDIGSIRGGRPSIYIHHRRLGVAPISVFGDALRRAVLLATTILTFEHGGILFIDEIETGIHVSSIRRVFRWLASVALSRDVQVFVTTHSLEAVDAIVFSIPDAQNEVVAFHLDQSPERTTAKRFDGDLLARLRSERGIDVR